jgi:hypothetical protein
MRTRWISTRPSKRVPGPDDAVRAVRDAVDIARTATVFLVLDPGRRVTVVLVVESPLTGDCLDRALEAIRGCASQPGSSIAAATIAPDRPTLPTEDEREAWRRLRAALADGGVILLDWLIINGHRWRSLAEIESSGPA